jgi:hypothetical protein
MLMAKDSNAVRDALKTMLGADRVSVRAPTANFTAAINLNIQLICRIWWYGPIAPNRSVL